MRSLVLLVLALILPVSIIAAAPLTDQATLGPGSAKLQGGQWAKWYNARVTKGRTCVLRVEAQGFSPYLVVIQPGDPQVTLRPRSGATALQARLTPARDGILRLAVASDRPGKGGSFSVTLEGAAAASPRAVTQGATPSVTPGPLPSTKSKPPPVPPAPEFEGAQPLDLTELGAGLPVPKPAPTTLQDPGALGRTLHQMNYLCVTTGAWSEMRETNWLYPRAGDTTHGSPRNFYTEADNQFWDPATAGNYTVPLQWHGNVFSCSHRRNLDDRGNLEMLDVTGTVSPNGDRVDWVMIREYVQEAYWDEKARESLLRRRLWKTIALVDLPLRNPTYNPELGDPARKWITMQERLKMVSAGLMTERMLNGGFHYGYSSDANAGSHVLDLGYLEQDPAVKNAPYIDPAQIHTVQYVAAQWSHPRGGDARVSFERRSNARQP